MVFIDISFVGSATPDPDIGRSDAQPSAMTHDATARVSAPIGTRNADGEDCTLTTSVRADTSLPLEIPTPPTLGLTSAVPRIVAPTTHTQYALVTPVLDYPAALVSRPFRDSDEGSNRWWHATGRDILSQPPAADITAHVGDLFVYKAKANQRIYVWLYSHDGWHRVRLGTTHPDLPTRVLWWRFGANDTKDQPTWITLHSYSTYQSRTRVANMQKRVSISCGSRLYILG